MLQDIKFLGLVIVSIVFVFYSLSVTKRQLEVDTAIKYSLVKAYKLGCIDITKKHELCEANTTQYALSLDKLFRGFK